MQATGVELVEICIGSPQFSETLILALSDNKKIIQPFGSKFCVFIQ